MATSAHLTPAQSTYLDFMRAAAAMTVLFGHGALIFLAGSAFSRSDVQAGGVLVFFLMSGFLISYSVFRKYNDPTYTFKDFFIDRFCRIYCAFLPALFFVWLVDMQTLSFPIDSSARVTELTWIPGMVENTNIITWVGNLFMMQDFPVFQILRRLGVPDNPFFVDEFGSASPFWTISIEWWIYMLFGTIVISLIRNKKPITFLFLCVLGFIAIAPFYYLIGGFDNCLTFLWIIGMLVSLLFINLPDILKNKNIQFSDTKWKLIYGGTFALAIILMLGRMMAIKFDRGEIIFTELQFATFLSLAVFAGLFFFGKFASVPRLLRKTIGFMADYSYSLYLTHATVMTYFYIRYPGHDSDPSFFWMMIAVSNIVAIIFWWAFERHHRRVAAWMKSKINRENKATA